MTLNHLYTTDYALPALQERSVISLGTPKSWRWYRNDMAVLPDLFTASVYPQMVQRQRWVRAWDYVHIPTRACYRRGVIHNSHLGPLTTGYQRGSLTNLSWSYKLCPHLSGLTQQAGSLYVAYNMDCMTSAHSTRSAWGHLKQHSVPIGHFTIACTALWAE